MISKALVAASLKPFVLSIFAEGPSYGYAILERINDLTEGRLQWTTGSLYPLLHSLENKGLLESFWRAAGPGPERKYYKLTRKGVKALEVEKLGWIAVNQALLKLWGPLPELSAA